MKSSTDAGKGGPWTRLITGSSAVRFRPQQPFFVFVLSALMLIGCASSDPDPCGDPIKVPAPYWNPPNVTADAYPNPQPILQTESFQCPPDVTRERCAELAIEALVADNLSLLSNNEECHFKFDGLVKLIEFVPPVSPPPIGEAPPLETPN
jgi:hypothetical protein